MTLPNFLVGGAPKAGTTALYNYLRQHPEICMSDPKETFFFTDEYERGVEWFSQCFDHCGPEKAIGEASTTTLYEPKAPERVQEVLGAPKFLFVLRDPVERAYSEYLFFVHKGRIPAKISFADVVLQKESEYAERILEMGRYEPYLSRFEEAFGREEMKILIHQEFRSAPESTLEKVFRFLDVDDTFRPDALEKHNVTKSPTSPMVYFWVRRLWHTVRNTVETQFPEATEGARRAVRKLLFTEEKPSMSSEVRKYLTDFYKDETARLEHRLERPLSEWGT